MCRLSRFRECRLSRFARVGVCGVGLSLELVRRIEQWLERRPTGSFTLDAKHGQVMKVHVHEYFPMPAEGEGEAVDKPR